MSKPISWLFDVCRDLESGLTSVDIESSATGEDGITKFIASTDAEDRAMDVVNQNWNLKSFLANSPILDNHRTDRVVGVGVRAEVVDGKLEIDVQWDDDNPDPSIRSVGHQHKKNIRRAGSVGFRAGQVIERDKLPKDHKFYREPVIIETWFGPVAHAGLFYDEPELLEFSSATVPMNPDALQRGFTRRHIAPPPSNPDEDFAAEVLRHLKGKMT